MKKTIRKQPRLKSYEKIELQFALTAMQMEKWDAAYDTLLPIFIKHPYDIDTLQLLNEVSFEVDDILLAWITSYRLIGLLPDESTGYLNASAAANLLKLPFTTLHYASLYLQRWGNEPGADEIRQLQAFWKKVGEAIRKNDPVNTARPDGELALLEQCDLLINAGEYQDGREISQKAMALMPDIAAPHNNIALSYALEGHLTEALKIAQQTVERFPDNFHARCNLAQFLVQTGQPAQAAKITEKLPQDLGLQIELWEILIETLSYMGDDAAIVNLYKQLQKTPQLPLEEFHPLVRHFIAVALARSGDPKQAKKLWKAALKDMPDLTLAEDNLKDIENPPGERNGPWALTLYHWVLPIWAEQIVEITNNLPNERGARSRIERLIRNTVGMETALKILLDRGDPYGREFAISMVATFPLEGLVEFVQSERGTDETRFRASEVAVDQGLLPRGLPVKMFQRGKQTELLFLNYVIDGETNKPTLPKNIQRLYTKSIEAAERNDFNESLQFAQEARALLPNHPMLMNGVALALMKLGQQQEGEALVRQNAALNPNYLFARCGMANLCLKEGQLDEAKEWIKPLLKRSHFHFSEFEMLAHVQASLLNAEGNPQAALQWLDLLNQTAPDDDTPIFEDKAAKRKKWRR